MALMTIVVSHNQNILYIFLESYAKVKCAVVAIFIQDNIMAICLQCGFDLDRSFEKLFYKCSYMVLNLNLCPVLSTLFDL
jgi:hypothetical protein